MKTINYLRTMMGAWCRDNAQHVRENKGMTFSQFMILDCEATDWNWFMEDEKIDNYTDEDIEEVKEFLKDYDYLPDVEEEVKWAKLMLED